MASLIPGHRMGIGALATVLAGIVGYVVLGTLWGWSQGESLGYSTTKSSWVAPCSKTAS